MKPDGKDLEDMNKDELKAWLDSATSVVNVSAYEKEHAEVHFFKDSGKWYTSETIPWAHVPGLLISEQFTESLARALKLNDDTRLRYHGMTAICVDGPAGYPIMTKVGER